MVLRKYSVVCAYQLYIPLYFPLIITSLPLLCHVQFSKDAVEDCKSCFLRSEDVFSVVLCREINRRKCSCIFTSDSRMLGVRTITVTYSWQLKSGMQFGVMEYTETVAAA